MVVLLFVSLVVYFASKIAFAKIQQIVFLQILNQMIILITLFLTFSVFMGMEEKLQIIPKRINSVLKFLAGMTLHIYLVQFMIIRRLEGMVFPVNFILTTVAIIIVACILYYIEYFVKKGMSMIVHNLKEKKRAKNNN